MERDGKKAVRCCLICLRMHRTGFKTHCSPNFWPILYNIIMCSYETSETRSLLLLNCLNIQEQFAFKRAFSEIIEDKRK